MWKIFKMTVKSKWIDVGMYDKMGYYKLVQMRYRLDNNKKEFRIVSLGFVNSYEDKPTLFKNIQAHNCTDFNAHLSHNKLDSKPSHERF
jgi:hypothetical protein